MLPYIEARTAQGIKLHAIARHLLELFSSQPGTKAWKRYIAEYGHLPQAGAEVIAQALSQIPL
jgi:tRNA-dihydrouridine synthase A